MPAATTSSTSTTSTAAAPPSLFTPEQTRLLQDSTTQLKNSLAGELKSLMGDAIVEMKTTLLTEMNNQVKNLEMKTAEVAAEKKAKTNVSSV